MNNLRQPVTTQHMLEHLDLSKVLILDIETVSQQPVFDDLDDRWKHLWTKKAAVISKGEQQPGDIYNRAAIYAEFGKIICISAGIFSRNGRGWQFRVKSFYGDDEKLLLQEFTQMLERHFDEPDNLLCAHNGKEFDYPYISRRCLITGVDIPRILNIAGKKPWEVTLLDTMELWKFGDYKSFTSLELLAAAFDIPTPKDDIDGSMVGDVYWREQDLERIRHYCQKDVVTVAQLMLRFRKEPLLDNTDIFISA
jgi:predicted PolB exonuclease-like 3'-5' exonuclease